MSLEGTFHTLHVAQEANSWAYRRMVQTSAPGDCWDVVVLTAADEKQAQGYRLELAIRQRGVGPSGSFFPPIQKSIVVADRSDKRPGSGGATLAVMQALQRELGIGPDQLRQLRILLIHSGGADRHLPMYAPLGKIFAPLPLLRPDGQIATLFDHLYITLSGLPDRLGPGMLIVAGDVFLLFDHRHVTASPPGVTAITMRVPAPVARGHGAFVTDAAGHIRQTLQKATVPELAAANAMDSNGDVLIDTGLLFFDADSTARLAHLAGVRSRKPAAGLQNRYSTPIDLYADMTQAMASEAKRQTYLSAAADPQIGRELWRTLHGVNFHVMEVEGEFLHLGTTQQLRDALTGKSPSPAAELFQQNILAHSQWKLPAGRRVYHSALLQNDAATGQLGEGSVIEHSILSSPSTIGDNSVVSQAVAIKQPLRLGDNLLFFQVPMRHRGAAIFAQVLCGIDDDFYGSLPNGTCHYLNQPIKEWLDRHGIDPRSLWAGIPAGLRTLWNARLFPATAQRDASGKATWLASPRRAGKATIAAWLAGPRFSLAMIVASADAQALIEHREVVAAYLEAGQIIERIRLREQIPADSLLGHHTTAPAYDAAEALLRTFATRPTEDPHESLQQARALWTLSQILSRPDHADPAGARQRLAQTMQDAFLRVATASEQGHRRLATQIVQPKAAPLPRKPLPPGVTIEATCPVRLDLTGGWSDTPPYCFEEGGHVINVSIDLDDRPPVRSIVKRLRENRFILESRDLGKTLETTAQELQRQVSSPFDPFALTRIALELTGFLQHPCGLHVITECRVPKGSGLGTSSILAATLLAALFRAAGHEPSTQELIEKTLLLEQRLSTGGGWQDQVGGIVGGVKSTLSSPGIPQRPVVEQLPLSNERMDDLEQRLVVYFSGQQRLARDILRRVEGQWLAREPSAVMVKAELKQSAAQMRQALLRGDWDAVAAEVNRYWRLKKTLYPGSTTPSIDVLLLELQGHYQAASLSGAGGGGFGFFLCRDARQATKLRDLLNQRSNRPGSLASVYNARINRTGLKVTVTRP